MQHSYIRSFIKINHLIAEKRIGREYQEMKKNVKILFIVIVVLSLLLVMPCVAANVTATVSPSTVTHGEKIFINGTAEGHPSSVAIWILGKNFAAKMTNPVNVDGSFSYEIMQDTTDAMYSGQYFVVVQHPGTNGTYDIDWSGAPAEYVYDYSGYGGTGAVSLFKIIGPGCLQGFDAFEALTYAIKKNQPYVDDTYTKAQFEIRSSSRIGIFRPSSGIWSLDANGNFAWEPSDTSLSWGMPNDIPVIGDWNGDGMDGLGIFRPSSGIWSIDSNENFIWEPSDKSLSWGMPGDTPVVGDWNSDGKDGIGIFRPSSGIWSIDSNENFIWEPSDKSLSWGLPNDKPIVGKH